MITEKDAWNMNGLLALVILAISSVVAIYSFLSDEFGMGLIFTLLPFILATGLTVIQPNEAIIVQFAGKYVGTYRQQGIVMFIPFSRRIKISLRERTFQSKESVVHDVNGTSVTMSILVLYKVVDTAKAEFGVENMQHYMEIQSEIALRKSMASYPYESLIKDESMLLTITTALQQDMYERLHRVGIDLIEVRLIPALSGEREEAFSKQENESFQLTKHILQLMENEKLISLDDEKRSWILDKLMVSLPKK